MTLSQKQGRSLSLKNDSEEEGNFPGIFVTWYAGEAELITCEIHNSESYSVIQ